MKVQQALFTGSHSTFGIGFHIELRVLDQEGEMPEVIESDMLLPGEHGWE